MITNNVDFLFFFKLILAFERKTRNSKEKIKESGFFAILEIGLVKSLVGLFRRVIPFYSV